MFSPDQIRNYRNRRESQNCGAPGSGVGDGPSYPVRLVWRWRGSAPRRPGVHCASSSPQLARAGGPGQCSQHSAAPPVTSTPAVRTPTADSDGDQPAPALGMGPSSSDADHRHQLQLNQLIQLTQLTQLYQLPWAAWRQRQPQPPPQMSTSKM